MLAGGQSLVPLLNLRLSRPAVLVDINRVEGLDRREGSAVGATVRQRGLRRQSRSSRWRCPSSATTSPATAARSAGRSHTPTRARSCRSAWSCSAGPCAHRPAASCGPRSSSSRTTRPLLEPDELLLETTWPRGGRRRLRRVRAPPRRLRARGVRVLARDRRRHDPAGARRASARSSSGRRCSISISTGAPATPETAREAGARATRARRPVREPARDGRVPALADRHGRRARADPGVRAGGGVIRLRVNGVDRRAEVEPRLLLSDFLRHELGLTGTHVGCEHGVCGACTVELDGVAVRSCLMLAVQADGCELRTVEGLPWGPLQEAFRRHHALQCGFCTPGILIAATDLLAQGRADPRGDRRHAVGTPLPLHGLHADRRCDRGGGAAMNLARSLLVACERFPEHEAFPGITLRASCCRACSASPAVSRSSRASGSRWSSTTGSRRRCCTGRRSGRARSPCRSRGASRATSSTTASPTAARRERSTDGDPLPDGPPHPGALERDEREPSLMLYTSGTTGRPKGVPRSHRADRAGGALAGRAPRLRHR